MSCRLVLVLIGVIVIGRATRDETRWRARVALAVDLGTLGGHRGPSVFLILWAKSLAIGVEVVR